VTVNKTWCTPAVDVDNNPTLEEADYIRFGPYDAGAGLTAVYTIQVPADATPGTCAFTDGTLEYFIARLGPYVVDITGEYQGGRGLRRTRACWRYYLSTKQAANAIALDCPWGSHHSCDKPAGAKAPQCYEIEDLIAGAECISPSSGGDPPLRSSRVSCPSAGEDRDAVLCLSEDGTILGRPLGSFQDSLFMPPEDERCDFPQRGQRESY
jgi:hypothetical protein